MDWPTSLSPEEIERRRTLSLDALKEIEAERFAQWYQERCDTFYWKNGRCCAGCDHWSSSEGDIGQCMAAPPVSGMDVLRSLDITWSSYIPAPGQPFTRHDHVCGAFKDDFDWSSLPPEYLQRVGKGQDQNPVK